jgi:anaerobic magnesium-protoporphyrin IX monomethyl ester cyclase
MGIKSILIVVPALVSHKNNRDIAYKYLDFETYRLVSPIEPATIGANLVRKGYEAAIFDLGACFGDGVEELTKKINEFQPGAVVVANSILTFGSTYDFDGKDVFGLVAELCPETVKILTGTHASNYPGKAIEEGVCDYSVKGEPDLVVADLIDSLNRDGDLSEIAGLSYRQKDNAVFKSSENTRVDLGDLPLPNYSLVEPSQRPIYFKYLEFGKIRFPEMSPRYRDIQTSKSCILDCSFCSVKHLRNQPYRRKPMDLILAEIESALDDGIEEIHFFDDLFIESEKQVMEFAEALQRKNLRFHWFAAQGLPLWPMTRDGLAALKETGMYRIICPFESGSDRVIKKEIGKLGGVEHFEQVVRWAKEIDLEVMGLFVIGVTGETRDDLKMTVDFAERNEGIDYSVFSIAAPLVGTRMTKRATKEGFYQDTGQLQKVIKRTVALYRTKDFTEVELGLIRAYDWDRINFSTQERREKYGRMVGMTPEQVELARKTSFEKFHFHFPDYDGPLSFKNLYLDGMNVDAVVPKGT